MSRSSHSTAARSGNVFEPYRSALNSLIARLEQRHTTAETPYPPERYPVAVPCPGPRACCLPPTCRAHEHGSHERDEDSEFSPYGQDVPRHVSHGYVNPKPVFRQQQQHSEVDSLGPSRSGFPYHRPSSYDAADRELDFDRRGRFGHYSPPQYDSANDDSCFDDVHGTYREYESPFESRPLLSFSSAKLDSPGPGSRSQDRENRDTNLDRSGRSRSLGRGSMEPPLGSYPDYADFELRHDHERDGTGPPLINHSYYTDLERRNFYGRGSVGPSRGSHPDHADFERRKDYDPERAGVRPAGRHPTRHRFEDDFEADELENTFGEALFHRPRLARPRGHHSDSDVGSIDTDTEEEYFEHIRDFDFVDDAIADRYTGRLRAPTAAEKTHRRYLVGLINDFDREHLRAEQAQASLRRLKRNDTYIGQSDTEIDSTLERLAQQVPNMYSSGKHSAAADFDFGSRKPSPRGRRYDRKSDSESITPQPQDTHPKVRQQVAAHPTTTNHNPSPHSPHNNLSRPRRAPDRPTRPQGPHSNSNTTLPKDQAPPSYDSVPPAQIANSVQTDPVNHTPHSPLATAATETTPPNSTNARPRDHAQSPMTPKPNNEPTSRPAAEETNTCTARPQQAVRTSPLTELHTSPADLGASNHSDSSDSGAATPMTSSDDNSRFESADYRLGGTFISR